MLELQHSMRSSPKTSSIIGRFTLEELSFQGVLPHSEVTIKGNLSLKDMITIRGMSLALLTRNELVASRQCSRELTQAGRTSRPA